MKANEEQMTTPTRFRVFIASRSLISARGQVKAREDIDLRDLRR